MVMFPTVYQSVRIAGGLWHVGLSAKVGVVRAKRTLRGTESSMTVDTPALEQQPYSTAAA